MKGNLNNRKSSWRISPLLPEMVLDWLSLYQIIYSYFNKELSTLFDVLPLIIPPWLLQKKKSKCFFCSPNFFNILSLVQTPILLKF